MFPVRVAVESVRSSHCISCANDGHPFIDTYAIVAGSTLLSQLVDTVLSALGHPHLAANARGMVQVNNWKALSFEQITDNPEETVSCLFKDISSHITLRILTKPSTSDSASAQCINELKQRLLKAAINKNPQLLSTVDNQQIRELITQIVSGDDPSVLNHEQINAINDWLETLDTGDERRSPTAQVRFNQLFEVPKLEKWFKSESNPSRQKLINYMNQLNSSPYRKSHAKITYQQICNWFQMQRASLRKSNSSSNNGNGNGHVLSQHQQQQLQAQLSQTFSLPTMLSEFRPKFDFSAFLNEQKASLSLGDESRMEGGSDSPSPADDEVHSNSDGGGQNDSFGITAKHNPDIAEQELRESPSASSPDTSVHLRDSLASSSPRLASDISSANNASLNLASQGSLLFPLSASHNSDALGSAARSRLMFDPLTELPILERWFEENPHPTWVQIDNYTNMLNKCPYRENYPLISQHNVKIWFKNRRAKNKRMQTGMGGSLKMENTSKLENIFS